MGVVAPSQCDNIMPYEGAYGKYTREYAHRGKKVTSAMVVEVARRLMGLEEKCRVRQKAAELGIMVRQSAEERSIMCKDLLIHDFRSIKMSPNNRWHNNKFTFYII